MSFDLSMLKEGVDIFVLIVQFLDDKWELCHITMGFLKIVDDALPSSLVDSNVSLK